MPFSTGIAKQVQLCKVIIVLQALYRQQSCLVKEVHCEVKLLQGLTALQVLYLGQIVHRHV